MKKLIIVGLLACVWVTVAYARYENKEKATQSTVAYGKYNGTIVAIAVSSDGILQTR